MDSTTAVVIAVCATGGLIAGMIGASKAPPGKQAGPFIGFFIFGALLPLIGILVAAFSKGPQPVPQPPGWYPDPWGQARVRWYDGAAWTWQTDQQHAS